MISSPRTSMLPTPELLTQGILTRALLLSGLVGTFDPGQRGEGPA